MPQPIPLPPELNARPFTTSQALAAGLSKDALSGKRIRRLFRGVHCYADLPTTPEMLICAALMILPADATLSHVTAVNWYGVTLGADHRLHFSTNTSTQTRLDGVVLHRRLGRLSPTQVRGVPILGVERTFVDCATTLGHVDLVRAGDWLVRLGLTSPDDLIDYAMTRHIDGVVRARRVSVHVCTRVDSVMETDLRLLLRFARLPSPEVNHNIFADDGSFLARGDLVYVAYRVIVEYDGWHHERDARQRQRDHLRRERLEANGWRVIVVTIQDMQRPSTVVAGVHSALTLSGYVGPQPVMSDSWRRWFHAA